MDIFGSGKGRVDNTDESAQEVIQGLSAYFPQALQTIISQYGPAAEGELGAIRKYAPELGKVNEQLLDTSGRNISKIGRELSRAEQLDAAQTEADIMAGSGQQAVKAAVDAQKIADPEYYKNRESILANLDTAFQAMGNDPTSLSKGETEQIARGLGRTNWRVGSPTQTISNALTFGDAGQKRRAEYNNLIGLRGNLSGALQSGINAPAVATSRTVLPNFGQQNYTGLTTPGMTTANTLGSSFMNNLFNTQNQRNSQYVQMNQGAGIGSGIGKIVGAVAAGAGCWVAREVYGEDSELWKIYRSWMLEDGPDVLKDTYMKYGEHFAAWIKGRPLVKWVVKFLMDRAINAKLSR